jgi:hypothetical protein
MECRAERAEYFVHSDPIRCLFTCVERMAASTIIAGVGDYVCADRIVMNVPHEPLQVGILAHKDRAMPALKQMPTAMLKEIDLAGILAGGVANRRREWLFFDLNNHVQVVCHPAEAVDTGLIAVQRRFKNRFPQLAITLLEENILMIVSTQNHMIKSTGKMYAEFARHASSV